SGDAAAGGFLRRLRPPLEPRRVRFFFGGASGSAAASPSADWPRSGDGTWIVAPAGASAGRPFLATGASSGFPFSAAAAAAGFFFRLRPPREPRRVFFLG